MSNAYQMGQILYEAETLHGEVVNTYATMQLPIVGAVDCSGLTQAKMDSQRAMAYRQGGTPYLLGVQGGSFKTKFYLCGHGTTTASTTTIGLLETLLGIVFGNATLTASSGTTASAGTATALTTAASATFTGVGGLFRLGALADTKGNGQFGVVASHVTTTLTSLVALPGAPTASDVVYSAVNIYPSENPTTSTVQTIRAQLLTANLAYNCHGVYAKAATFSGTNFQEFLAIEIEWGVSWFTEVSATFPSTVTTERYNGAPNVGGSVFVGDVGTSTRGTTRKARSFSLAYKLGVAELPGPEGYNAYQSIVAVRRTPDEIMVSWSEDAPAQTATPSMVTEATATTAKHILASFTTPVGASVGMYFPNVCITERPSQFQENGINRLRFTGRAYTGLTTTSDLTLSAFRMALA